MKSIRPTVIVKTKRISTIGLMYFKTSTHIVLLNNVVEKAELGRLRQLRKRHVEPEATVVVIPRVDVERIEVIAGI